MAAPITWKNVTINNGASAAAFGNSAANFGRTAIQGLDIFSGRMQERIDREDTLRTNQAIGDALRGGPATSGDRRVDANALQLAVERQRQGERLEEAHDDDLLTSAVNRRLNTATAGVREKDLETYDDRWALEQQTAQSESDYRAAQARIAEAELKLKQKAEKDQDRIRAGRSAMNQYLYGGGIDQQFEQAYQQQWGNDSRVANLSPEEQRMFREQQKQEYRASLFQDPEAARELYQRFGLQPIEAEQFTSFGQDMKSARELSQKALAERQALVTEESAAVRSNAKAYSQGKTNQLSHNGQDWTYDGGPAVNDDVKQTVLRDMGFDPTDDDVKEFANAIGSQFRTATAWEAAARQIAGKYQGDLPDAKTIRQEVKDLSAATKKQAEQRSKVEAGQTYTGDYIASGNRFLEAMTSGGTPDASEADSAEVFEKDPQLGAQAIRQINGEPQTAAEVKESGEKLKLAVAGLQDTEIKLPEDPSRELQNLWNRYQRSLKIADGQPFVRGETEGFGGPLGLRGPGDIARPEVPKFADKQDHAAQAADMLVQLQQMIEAEKAAKKSREFRNALDQY